MYPHRIRLRGPWECEPLSGPGPARRVTMPCRWSEVGLADLGGRVRCRRRFGYPGRIACHERVWLTFEGADDRLEVWLNGVGFGQRAGDRPCEFEVTGLLQERNELVVSVEGPADRGGLWGEVALEVRCSAFLRNVRAWLEGQDDELHVAGEVVGEADGLLEVYVVRERSVAAYATVLPSREGQPFHLQAAGAPAATGQAAQVQIDLVNGATVWYTVRQEVGSAPSAGPLV
jgi:hypothetical protein